MKKIIFLPWLLLSFMVVKAQTTITTPQPPTELEYKQKVKTSLTAGPSGASFRFIHPDFGRALESSENLQDYWIESRNLSEESSLYEINLSVVDFYKGSRFQKNRLLLRDNIPHQTSKMLGFWEFPHAQCGDYALMSIYGVESLCVRLGLTPPLFEQIGLSDIIMIGIDTISNGGHTFYQYYDYQIGFWVPMDPDVGTTVSSYRDSLGPVSFGDVLQAPEMMLDTNNPVWLNHYEIRTAEQALQTQYDFIYPMLQHDISYTEVSEYQEDDRVMVFDLPAGLTATWEVEVNSFSFNVDELTPNGSIDLEYCDSAFEAGDSIGMISCLEALSVEFGVPMEVMLEISFEGLMEPDTITRWKVFHDNETFLSIELPPGEWDLGIPTILRSTEPSIVGLPYQIDGVYYTDSTYLDVYFPNGSDVFDLPEVYPDTAQYGAYCSVPQGMTLTVTFLFNYQLFKFWQQSWEVLVEDGNLELDQVITYTETGVITSIKETQSTDKDFSFYPNPAKEVLFLSEPSDVKIYSLSGQLVQEETNKSVVHLIITPGYYILEIGSVEPTFHNLAIID